MTRNRTVLRVALTTAVGFASISCADDSLRGLPTKDDTVTEDPIPECETSLDCGPDYICQDGTCVALCETPPCDEEETEGGEETEDPPIEEDPPVDLPLFVGGTWNVTYHFDWSDYLGPLGDWGTPIDTIDQVLMGNTEVLDIPVIGDLVAELIQDIVDEYIPDWVGDLVHLLNGIVHFFQDVRFDTRMTLAHTEADPTNLYGSELWDWGYLSIIDQCPLGEFDPAYPTCAEFPVPINFYIADFGEIEATTEDFVGTIDQDTDWVSLPGREVNMQIGRFVLFVINSLVNFATGGSYTTLEAGLQALIDCVALGAEIATSFGSATAGQIVEVACTLARDAAIDTMMTSLDSVTVDWEVMKFDMGAFAYDDDGDRYGDRLAAPPAELGELTNGEFEVLFDSDLEGSWSGTRP